MYKIVAVILQLILNPFDVNFITLQKDVEIHSQVDLVKVWHLQHPWSMRGVHIFCNMHALPILDLAHSTFT